MKRSPSKTKKAYHHGDLRQALIRESVRLIIRRNGTHFTLRELASQASVSHGAAYRHFSSKDEIIAAVAEIGFRELERAFIEVRKKTEGRSALEEFRELGKAYLKFALGNEGYYRTMFHSELVITEDTPELKRAAENSLKALHEVIARGIQEEVFAKKDLESLVTYTWAAVHGLALLLLDRQLPCAGEGKLVGIDELASGVLPLIEAGLK